MGDGTAIGYHIFVDVFMLGMFEVGILKNKGKKIDLVIMGSTVIL